MGRAKPRSIHFGDREIVSKGLSTSFWGDLRHQAVKASWPMFVLGAAVAFIVINCGFAVLYTAGNAPIANSSGSFLDNLFFSIETYATVGYGDMHPHTTYGHVVASLEVFTGILTVAMITALVFLRFTLIRPRILFADVGVVATHDGQRSLMVRLANQRMNEISVAQARMWILMTYQTAEGTSFRRFEEMTLLRNHSPLFTLSWTVIHPIDTHSPLHGVDQAKLVEQDAAVMIVIDGQDETTGQSVRARKTYYMENLRFGHRYLDILEVSESRRTVLNYAQFHLTAEERDQDHVAAATAPSIANHPA